MTPNTLILPPKLYLSPEQSERLVAALDKLRDATGTVMGDVNEDGVAELLCYWRRHGVYVLSWPKMRAKK